MIWNRNTIFNSKAFCICKWYLQNIQPAIDANKLAREWCACIVQACECVSMLVCVSVYIVHGKMLHSLHRLQNVNLCWSVTQITNKFGFIESAKLISVFMVWRWYAYRFLHVFRVCVCALRNSISYSITSMAISKLREVVIVIDIAAAARCLGVAKKLNYNIQFQLKHLLDTNI